MTANKDFKRLVRQRAQRTGESYVTARRHLLRTSQKEVPVNDRLVSLAFESVHLENVGEAQQHMIWLREREGTRQLTIFIGPSEAEAIALGAQRVDTPRPLTHDMLKQAVDALGGHPARIEIGYRPEASTFTADLFVERQDGDAVHFDCRPSDAIALAVRYDTPPDIFVAESLLGDAPPAGSTRREERST